MSSLQTRKDIDILENELTKLPQVEIIPTHRFAEGLYVREIVIPKGTLLTGKIHKASHVNIISKGDITVMTEDGLMRIKAPFTMISKPGTKRVGYAHEDTVWTTVHATQETNLEKIEETLVCMTHEEMEESCRLSIQP